jgi:peroxiredoxin
MISKTRLLTPLALSIGLIALPLIHFDFHVAAVFSIFIGFCVAVTEFYKHTRLLQFITIYFNAIVFGIALDQFSTGLPYFTAMFLMLTFTQTVRMHFHRLLLLSRAIWIEPLFAAGTVALYVIANLNSVSGWLGWTITLVPILYMIYNTIGAVITGVNAARASRKPLSVGVGMPAPHFMLTDHDGNLISMNDYKGRKHILVLFVRGDWCPTCHIMLRTYQKNNRKFRERDVMVVAIGPDPMGVNREMVEKLGLEFKVLADPDHETAHAYGIHLQGNAPLTKYEEGIPMPAAFLIDRNGIIIYSSRHDRIGEILDPADIFPVLESLPQTI